MSQLPAEKGFTLVELLITVSLMLILSSIAAVGLTRRIPVLKLQAKASLLLEVLRSQRGLAISGTKARKVRIHQTRRVSTVEELFEEDRAWRYGTHQVVFAAPIELWWRDRPLAEAVMPSQVLPLELKGNPSYDAGDWPTLYFRPMLNGWDLTLVPPVDAEFPRAIAALKLPEAIELGTEVRIVLVNGRPTYGNAGSYATSPWREPLPSNPVPVSGSPPRPESGHHNTRDDRIVDVTYSPDGTVQFAPMPAPATPAADYTLTLATEAGASLLSPPYAVTLTIDRVTGLPRI